MKHIRFNEYKKKLRGMEKNELWDEYSKVNTELGIHKVEWHRTRGGKVKEVGRFSAGALQNEKKKRAVVLTIMNQRGINKPR